MQRCSYVFFELAGDDERFPFRLLRFVGALRPLGHVTGAHVADAGPKKMANILTRLIRFLVVTELNLLIT